MVHTVIAEPVLTSDISLNSQKMKSEKAGKKLTREEGLPGKSRKKDFCVVNDGFLFKALSQFKTVETVCFF